MDLKKYVGKKIRYFRLNRGLTQSQLADALNTTKQAISRYELGDRTANQDVIFDLAVFFNVSVNAFFPSKKEDDFIYIKNDTDTMNKLIPEGSDLVIKPATIKELKDGDIVYYKKGDTSYMNYFYKEGEKTLLRPCSYNKKHYDILINSCTIDIIGKIISYTVEIKS